MAFEHYIRSGERMLRCGYTTGTCAALAAAGALELLLTGSAPPTVGLITPAGIEVEVPLEDCRVEENCAVCAVRKDGGDDPDVTDGMLIYASVSRREQGIALDGGEGIGRVTRAGLDQPVGAAAINSVPRRMILAAVEERCAELGYSGGLRIQIFAPEGAARAKKTFNPMLGIEGGISILGTSGIVEPMSEKAIVDTIAIEARQARLAGEQVILVPGNYGTAFLQQSFPWLSDRPRVKISNYIGESLDILRLEGFSTALLVGHVGKLVKLAGGIMNTHSRVADCRRELFCAHAAACGAGNAACNELMAQVTTDGCIAVLDRAELRQPVMGSLLTAIQYHLDHRAGEKLTIGAILFSNEYGLLGITDTGKEILKAWRA